MNWYIQCAVFKVLSDWTLISHSITEMCCFSLLLWNHWLKPAYQRHFPADLGEPRFFPTTGSISNSFRFFLIHSRFLEWHSETSTDFFFLLWQPPTLPYRFQYSTLGRSSLNRRVRDGYGCVPWTHRHQKSFVFFFLLIRLTYLSSIDFFSKNRFFSKFSFFLIQSFLLLFLDQIFFEHS